MISSVRVRCCMEGAAGSRPPRAVVTMRLPSEIQGTREERVAQFKNDAELMGVATKLVSEVIEKAKGEAMKRRKVSDSRSSREDKRSAEGEARGIQL
ncbi:Adenylate dimethylallyltransferase [Frankliniella fusca]|uniref:Adenylate dimethylallyltransferase n=1 Tax=Frankliniella fusca TaxID=407009 RepID=A0AAE1L9T0_9NEOP|nr:Adenylate dimethylallyltransferase [Frankliniella fusca]